MTGGLGFTKHMQQSFKNNRKLLNKSFEGTKDHEIKYPHKKIILKKSDPGSILRLRNKLAKENKKETMIKIFAGLLITAVIVVLALVLAT